MTTPPADYDNSWKQAIELYFEQFILLCFAQLHPLIDWSRGFHVLEQELQQIVGEAESGKRLADKLFQVWLLNGEETWVLIHIEVQSQTESDFAKRMYQYNYRAFDKYERPVISLAVLGDETNSWRPALYEYVLDGFQLRMHFPIVKVLDYESQWEDLEQSANPFAIMIMAHLKTKATSGNLEERKLWKWTLVRGLFEKGYTRDDIVQLFRAIDRMMALPRELQQQFKQEVNRYQEERRMRFLSRIEEEAIEEGIQQGVLQAVRGDVIEVLEMRFQEVSPELNEALNKINDVSVLKQLHRVAITVNSISEFQQLL
ncbi:Rpn family recombination-promoting nuclease/putative transposase [Argonema galeatum]|uniref:Rpn family recombination-promoting nuclease/putative transposase n=1 Tax=Argonema galeatum TaxID=2942762 RepID=UPI0020138961|nr:Rpn family recombination-promoting nuclease/putative transposase [Argonema galeatum]MCL1466794.1 Rpn family recombination-promoting nuclease/putative transposase [Argonema galeatum A003/A1]